MCISTAPGNCDSRNESSVIAVQPGSIRYAHFAGPVSRMADTFDKLPDDKLPDDRLWTGWTGSAGCPESYNAQSISQISITSISIDK